MTELWIPITITAALFQTWRTAMQQRLKGVLGTEAAAFIRFAYGAPLAFALLLLLLARPGETLPPAGARFVALCAAGGLFQILATNLLIMAFGFRNFAVGTAYSKTEAPQAAVMAWWLLDETLRPLGWAGLGVALAGVMVLSLAASKLTARDLLTNALQPAALCGIGAGFLFGLTAIFFRAASTGLPSGDFLTRAILTLSVTTTLQTVMAGAWLRLRKPEDFLRAFTTWRQSVRVGLLSVGGSACWFTAFTLAPVGPVRALGQVELLFTLAFSRFYLGERPSRSDILGAALVVAGVVAVVLGR
jgi:drug/metabolite transporter (DMT)-like permease